MPDAMFTQFVGDSLPALSRYAYALTGDRHAGEDLVQETLIKMARAWRRIRSDGHPLAYARAVMVRTYISRWRTVRRRPVVVELIEEPTPGDAYADADIRDALRRALSDLPRLQRAVLVLGYLDDLADDEIAQLLDRRPATVRSLRRRGLQALRQRLEPHTMTEVSHGSN